MRKRVLLYGQGIYMRRGWISISYNKNLCTLPYGPGWMWVSGPIPAHELADL